MVVPVAVPVPLAHGSGGDWEGLITLLSVGIGVVFLLAIFRRIKLERPGDLVSPLAAVAVLAAVAPVVGGSLNEFADDALPVGVVLLVAMILSATTSARIDRPVTLVIVAGVAIGASMVFARPLHDAWHPQPEMLALAEDVEVRIVEPADGAEVTGGTAELVVAVDNGTIGPLTVLESEWTGDWQELGHLHLYVDGELVDMVEAPDCTIAQPCREVTFPVALSAGAHELSVEFVAWNHNPFAPPVNASVAVTVAATPA